MGYPTRDGADGAVLIYVVINTLSSQRIGSAETGNVLVKFQGHQVLLDEGRLVKIVAHVSPCEDMFVYCIQHSDSKHIAESQGLYEKLHMA